MTEETTQPISVSEMLRMTGENTTTFMLKVAEHIEDLEKQLVALKDRIVELEGKASDTKSE
jgi:hypothetical protein